MARKGKNIRKRSDGRYEARVTYIDEYGNKKYRSIYGKTKKEVEDKLKKLKNSDNVIKFLKQSEVWLKEKQKTIKQSSYARYFSIVKKYLNPFFGEMSVNKIDEKMIEGFKNSLNNELSNKTQADIIRVLNNILRFRKERITTLDSKAIKSNDCSGKEVLTKEEIVEFIKYLGKDTNLIKLGILLLICTGIQIGELCALKWEDIKLREGYVIINKTVQRISRESVNGISKTELVISVVNERKIPLIDFLQDKLTKQENSGNCFILTGTSKGCETSIMRHKLKQILKDAGLKDDFTFRNLRDSFIVIAIESGMDLRVLGEILGVELNSLQQYFKNIAIKDSKQEMTKLCLI